MSPARVRGVATAALLLLTAATGAIDAVSYLSLDRVFTGNMTGNLLFLGFALTGVEGIPVLNNSVALLGFVLGAVVGGRVVPRGTASVLPRASIWTLVSGTAVGSALCVIWAVTTELDLVGMLVVTGLLAAMMGAQVAAVKPIGNADITTVVVTSTLANLARDSRLAGAPRGANARWVDRLLAVVAMGAGAAAGAAVIRWLGGAAALGLGLGLVALAVVALAVLRRTQRRVAEAADAAEGSPVRGEERGPGRSGVGAVSGPAPSTAQR